MNPFYEIQQFFETEYPLNKHGLEELLTSFKQEIYPKGTRILEAETQEKQLRFLNRGLVREYYSTMEKETNINFFTHPQFITDLSPFMQDSPTKKHQESLTQIELFTIDKTVFQALLSKYECGKSIIDQSFHRLLTAKERFEYNRITKTADELYQDLQVYKPHWLAKIPQYHIASYLNITPETLSRIRKRIS